MFLVWKLHKSLVSNVIYNECYLWRYIFIPLFNQKKKKKEKKKKKKKEKKSEIA